MELDEFNRRIAFKVFNKKEVETKLSPLFKTNFTITMKANPNTFLNVEYKPTKIDGKDIDTFIFRTRFHHPDKYRRMTEDFTHPLTEKEAIAYLKLIKPLTAGVNHD